MGTAVEAEVNRLVQYEVGVAFTLGVDFHLAEVTVAAALLAGHVVHIVNQLHVFEVVGQDGGVVLADLVRPLAVVDGREVAVD